MAGIFMNKNYFENYKKILKQHKFQVESDQQIFEIVKNIEALSNVIYEFHQSRKNNKKLLIKKYGLRKNRKR